MPPNSLYCPLPPAYSVSIHELLLRPGRGADAGVDIRQRQTGPCPCGGWTRPVSSDPRPLFTACFQGWRQACALWPCWNTILAFQRRVQGRGCRLRPWSLGPGPSWSESGLAPSYFCHELVLSPKPGILSLCFRSFFLTFSFADFTPERSCLDLHYVPIAGLFHTRCIHF